MPGSEAARNSVPGLVYLDACLLIYACESHPQYGPAVKAALASQPNQSFAMSALARMECLVARHGLKTPDALHLACAQHHGCTALWTNDDRLAQAGHGLAVNVLARGRR